MVMNKSLILLLAVTVFLTACAPSISGTVINDTPDPDDPCATLLCGPNEVCQEGACECQEGFKLCDEVCIAEDACCTAADCEDNQVCEENKCTFSCDKTICSANKICDESLERCICPENYIFCDSQDKCIPDDHCCNRFDCGIDEKCLPTVTSSDLCFEDDQSKACKLVDTKQNKTIILHGRKFVVGVLNFFYLESLDVSIDNQTFTLAPGIPTAYDNTTKIFTQKMREQGGRCLDFDFENQN